MSQGPYRLLVVGDHSDAVPMLASTLKHPDFALHQVAGVESALSLLSDTAIDLLVLACGCCLRSREEMLARLRACFRGGLLLVGECADGGACALEQGVDDWVPLNAHPRELLARLRNLAGKLNLMRGQGRLDDEALRFSGWRLDGRRRELTTPEGNVVRLTGAETALLSILVSNPGQPLRRDWLLGRVSSRGLEPTSRSIDVTIAQLRRKLGDDPRHPRFILTMHGVGYRFVADPA